MSQIDLYLPVRRLAQERSKSSAVPAPASNSAAKAMSGVSAVRPLKAAAPSAIRSRNSRRSVIGSAPGDGEGIDDDEERRLNSRVPCRSVKSRTHRLPDMGYFGRRVSLRPEP